MKPEQEHKAAQIRVRNAMTEVISLLLLVPGAKYEDVKDMTVDEFIKWTKHQALPIGYKP